jgi:cell division protein FtsQ
MEVRKVTRTFKILLFSTIFLSLVFMLNEARFSRYFPIKTVRVYGVNRVDQQEVQDLILPLVKHGFFAINVDYVRDRLLQMPWVANLNVRRIWPDKVEITVIERHAIANWNNEGLVSESGEIFSPKHETYPNDLPQFAGPAGKQVEMLKQFKQMNRILTPLHAKISYLELTPYATWKLKLDNGISMQVGHKDILTRLDHFVRVYPKIVGDQAALVDYIDLRYPNGVAVRWKTPITT